MWKAVENGDPGATGLRVHLMQKNPWLSSEAYTKFRYIHGIQSFRGQPFAKLCNLQYSSDTGSHMTWDSLAWTSATSEFPNPGSLLASSGVLSACYKGLGFHSGLLGVRRLSCVTCTA